MLFKQGIVSAILFAGMSIVAPAYAAVPASASANAGRISSAIYPEARRVADWITLTNDNAGLPFMVIDKVHAELFLFDAAGRVRASTSALLGRARGDDSPPGIGNRRLSDITPGERITPAGRFVTHVGQDLDGTSVLWIDYAAAIALHRASDRKPGMSGRSRSKLLFSTTPAEKRVSLGCVNVSAQFYTRYVEPTFGLQSGITYILPETRSATLEFNMGMAESRLPGI